MSRRVRFAVRGVQPLCGVTRKSQVGCSCTHHRHVSEARGGSCGQASAIHFTPSLLPAPVNPGVRHRLVRRSIEHTVQP